MSGSLKRLKINGVIYKFREEEGGYYTYIPTIGKFMAFNNVAIKIIEYISEGKFKEEIIDKFAKEYPQIERETFVEYISDFFNELKAYKMI